MIRRRAPDDMLRSGTKDCVRSLPQVRALHLLPLGRLKEQAGKDGHWVPPQSISTSPPARAPRDPADVVRESPLGDQSLLVFPLDSCSWILLSGLGLDRIQEETKTSEQPEFSGFNCRLSKTIWTKNAPLEVDKTKTKKSKKDSTVKVQTKNNPQRVEKILWTL